MMKKLKYQQQDSELTLREGIEEYYAANPHLLQPSKLADDGAQFFECHDRIHVVFGLDTSFVHEMKADLWTAFGTDLGILGYLKTANNSGIKTLAKNLLSLPKEEQQRFKKEILDATLISLLLPFKVYQRAAKMRRKWPWHASSSLLDRKLKDIRAEYNIQLFE